MLCSRLLLLGNHQFVCLCRNCNTINNSYGTLEIINFMRQNAATQFEDYGIVDSGQLTQQNSL